MFLKLQKLLKENIRPKIEKIDECYDEDWEFWEKFYIQKYKNDKMTNIESGGKSETLRKYTVKGTNKNTKEDANQIAVPPFAWISG